VKWRHGCTECDEARALVRRARKEMSGLHELRDRQEARIRELLKTVAFMERELRRAGALLREIGKPLDSQAT
jgi:type II secretory pathway component PulJ